MRLVIDTTSGKKPFEPEVRMVFSFGIMRFAVPMAKSYARVVGANLLRAVEQIEKPDAYGEVIYSDDVVGSCVLPE